MKTSCEDQLEKQHKFYKIGMAFGFILFCISVLVTVRSCNKAVGVYYSTPDTTIVIKNGKADTTIEIKQKPSFFK